MFLLHFTNILLKSLIEIFYKLFSSAIVLDIQRSLCQKATFWRSLRQQRNIDVKFLICCHRLHSPTIDRTVNPT